MATTAGREVSARAVSSVSRVAAVLAFLLALWALWLVLLGDLLVLPVMVLLVWLGVGAWRRRFKRTVALGVVGAMGAVWISAAAIARVSGNASYPRAFPVLWGIQIVICAAIATAALVSTRPWR